MRNVKVSRSIMFRDILYVTDDVNQNGRPDLAKHHVITSVGLSIDILCLNNILAGEIIWLDYNWYCIVLTHWGRVTHICVSKLTIIGSDNGLSPGRRQAIIWTNAGILLIRTLGTNFSEILGEIHSFSFSKMHLKMSSAKWRLFGLGLSELTHVCLSRKYPHLSLEPMLAYCQLGPSGPSEFFLEISFQIFYSLNAFW